MIWELGVVTGDGFARGQFLGFQCRSIGGQDELGLGLGGLGAVLQGRQRLRHPARLGHSDVDMVALEHAVRYVGGVAVALAQALESRFLVAERRQELERKFDRIEGLQCQFGDGGFDLDGVHRLILTKRALVHDNGGGLAIGPS